MLALIGENKVRLFYGEEKGNTSVSLTYDEFFRNHSKNISKIVLDRSCIDFSLDKIKSSSFYDAFSSLQCKRKISCENERIFLVNKKHISLFSKNDFFIQTNTINDLQLYKNINAIVDEIFLMEYAICELCKTVTVIGDNTWWLYVAEHKSSGIKIVAGLGNGIVYSRLFNERSETERKIIETIKFLTREGLNEDIKIISFCDDLQVENLSIINPGFSSKDIEIDLVQLIESKRITQKFSKDNYIRRFFNENSNYIFSFLVLCFCICIFSFGYLCDEHASLKSFIRINENQLRLSTKDNSKTLSVEINPDNLDYVKSFVDVQSQINNPVQSIKIISDFLKKYSITAEKVFLENDKNDIKIRCTLSFDQLNKLKKFSSDFMKIEINELEKINAEYEELDDSFDKNYGVEICVSLK